MYRTAAVLIALGVALGVAIVGCAGNDGGSTTCTDFTGMTTDARGAAVAKMLKERNGLNPSTRAVEATVAAALSACSSPENMTKTIEAVTP